MDAAAEKQLGELDLGSLRKLVKESQRQQFAGKLGDWKNYVLTKTNKGTIDPAHHDKEAMLSFIKTLFSNKAQQGLLKQLLDSLTSLESTVLTVPVLPKEYPSTGIWHLVNRTQQHAKYKTDYTFKSHDDGWIVPQRRVPDFKGDTRYMALDCEMCSTTESTRELLSATLVDQDGRPLMNELVQPAGSIIDLRSSITGITIDKLKSVTKTRQEVTQQISDLLDGNTVLVGHGLHHDLRSLKLDYWPVIDTAMVYSFKDMPEYTPSLSQLCHVVLDKTLRKEGTAHCALDDAVASLDLTLHAAKPDTVTELLAASVTAAKSDLKRLMIHGIPTQCVEADLQALFPETSFCVVGAQLPGAKKLLLEFKNPNVANTVFKDLVGTRTVDTGGRAQKKVVLTSGLSKGGTVSIRRMSAHNGTALQSHAAQAGKTRKKTAVAKSRQKNGEAAALVKKARTLPVSSSKKRAAREVGVQAGLRRKRTKKDAAM